LCCTCLTYHYQWNRMARHTLGNMHQNKIHAKGFLCRF
jgi:hypothetical protein